MPTKKVRCNDERVGGRDNRGAEPNFPPVSTRAFEPDAHCFPRALSGTLEGGVRLDFRPTGAKHAEQTAKRLMMRGALGGA